MEQKYNASLDQVFECLTKADWLEQRCLALGELSASCKTRKAAGGVIVTMKRRVHRELPSVIAKLASPESDLEFVETWNAEEQGARRGSMIMTAAGLPVKMTAEFDLLPVGRTCVYRIHHRVKASVPLLAGTIEKFLLAQIEQGCAEEFAYLVAWLKKSKHSESDKI